MRSRPRDSLPEANLFVRGELNQSHLRMHSLRVSYSKLKGVSLCNHKLSLLRLFGTASASESAKMLAIATGRSLALSVPIETADRLLMIRRDCHEFGVADAPRVH